MAELVDAEAVVSLVAQEAAAMLESPSSLT